MRFATVIVIALLATIAVALSWKFIVGVMFTMAIIAVLAITSGAAQTIGMYCFCIVIGVVAIMLAWRGWNALGHQEVTK